MKGFTMSVSGSISRLVRGVFWALSALWLCGVRLPGEFPVGSQAASVQASARQSRAGRDWKKQPAIVELDTAGDVFTIGDVHGDYKRLVGLLTTGQIIDPDPAGPERVRWRAGKSILVCTGDLIDKGPHSLKVIALFRTLQEDAARAGGQVIVLMGNHEAEFLADPADDDKAQEFLKELEKEGLDPKDVAAGRDALGVGEFLRGLPFAVRVNDWFFAHAGHTNGRDLNGLRSELEEEVDEKGYEADILLGKKGLLEARLHKRPWWEKEGELPEKSRARLERYVRALGVRHLVIGHQPGKVTFADGSTRKKGEIYQKFDGLIFLIDVGMSEAIDYSHGALLHISGGKSAKAVAIFPDGNSQDLWQRSRQPQEQK
ncbi:MAG TPA: metallophosphoesterase [Gemmataceae bacterium]|nr:metallophosphoesterase [Gemmataceae bacterium]